MTRPLRVAFVAPEILPWLSPRGPNAAGGAERQQSLLARELSRCGVDVAFVTLDTDGSGSREERRTPAEGEFACRILRACRPTAGLPIFRFVHPRLTSIWRALRDADADVYYQRCAGMLTGVVGAFCRLHRRGFVFASAHETDCDPKTAAISNPRDRALYALGLRLAHAVVAQTDEQRALFRDRRIDAAIVRNASAGGDEPPLPFSSRRHVLFLSALRPWKRAEWFVEIARRIPGTPFVLAGGAEPLRPGYAARLLETAAAVPNLETRGPVSRKEARDLHREALAFVSTSTREGFPNTTLEAWEAGTPVFATSDPDGCIARSGGGAVAAELGEIAARLEAGLAARASLEAMGRRGRAHLADHHDPARSASELLAILERAAGRGAGRGGKVLVRRTEGALR